MNKNLFEILSDAFSYLEDAYDVFSDVSNNSDENEIEAYNDLIKLCKSIAMDYNIITNEY